tara:strand:+ start:1160 stop:1354 length:195 start_codon:yes stop_codon:yes gene_type:complete
MKNIFKVLWSNPDKRTWKEPDPEDLTVDNAYKTRWIWYHTILGIELALTNILLIAILVLLGVKL